MTVLPSLKLPFVKSQDNLRSGYTPPNARAFTELEVFRKFNDGKDPVVVIIIILAKDGGSMTRISHLNETLNIVDYVGTHFAVKNYTYYRMCKDFCDVNEPIRQFRNGLLMKMSKNNDENKRNNSIMTNLSFPIMQFFGRDLDLSPYFFGQISEVHIEFAELIVLHFRTRRPSEWSSEDAYSWERLVGSYLRNEYNSSLIRPIVFSMAYTQDEIVRAGLALMPYISVGFIVMCVFAVGTVSIGSSYMKQFSLIKVGYALLGCVTPLMATSTALGSLILLGLRPGSILCVTPFLVLAIGVDDAFLMINAWNRTELEIRNGTASYKTIQEHIGPSITITSLTNMLAFGIGILTTPTPEIQLLCIANTAAILLDYLYTITLYAALYWDFQNNATIFHFHIQPFKVGNFLNSYCKFLSSGFASVLTFILLILYWTTSIRGALMAKGRLTPEKLFLADSPMLEVFRNFFLLRNKFIMPSYTFVTVFITNPGDLRNSLRRKRVKELIAQFEAVPRCKGSRFTHFWLRDYEAYLQSKNEETDENGLDDYTSKDLLQFLKWPEYDSWSGFMKIDNQTNRLTAFYVTVTYHDIGASVYEEEALFTDQIDSLVPTTIQTSFVILACMGIVCYIFMTHIFTVLLAILATTSICIGVFGLLTLWNIDVDPVSMATMIMSIGLSVDFPAHITFHYYRTGYNSQLQRTEDRLADCFNAIGFPLLQCSLSTVFFFLILLLIPSYMSEVFTKAIVLVISLGTIHALVTVPALLCAFSNIYQCFSFIKNKRVSIILLFMRLL
ncbi:unnamed protein product [Thelazia callipaeda]|uniref:SSD domain-containing protein n=1 Tax=Thelazia callipaeda TaxID=103827 RepID=A0A0N5CLZ5_THECL|nr:unnamed protein product [Thelazia callipaeda]